MEEATLTLPHTPTHSRTVELTVSTGVGTTGSPADAFLASNGSGLGDPASRVAG